MRRFVLTLMILLLPLRGWMGDAMAMQDAGFGSSQLLNAIVSVANNPAEISGEAHSHANMDHRDHGATVNHTDGEAHAACHLCDLCHSTALAMACLPLTLHHAAQGTPVGHAPSDTSATLSLRQKPPIS